MSTTEETEEWSGERCRSCRAPVVWAQVRGGGKRVILDAEPVDNGNIVLSSLKPGGPMEVAYLKRGDEPLPFAPRYVSHFVTCPDSEQWRKKKEVS